MYKCENMSIFKSPLLTTEFRRIARHGMGGELSR